MIKPSPTRRDILAAFLGLPAALAGCSSSIDTPPLPAGQIVGPSEGIGHKLRDGLRVTVPAEKWQRRGVVIVGGGIAGLSAAWRFLKAGFTDFTLLELEPAPGGTSRFWLFSLLAPRRFLSMKSSSDCSKASSRNWRRSKHWW